MILLRTVRAVANSFCTMQNRQSRTSGAGLQFSPVLIVFAVLLGSACAANPARQAARPLPEVDRLPPGIALATFDSVWSIVNRSYVDTAFVSRRWRVLRDSLRPRAAWVGRRPEVEALLSAMLSNIPESHFYIIPSRLATDAELAGDGESAGEGTTGVAVRFAGIRPVAWQVEQGSTGYVAGIRPGDVIESIGGRSSATAVAQLDRLPVASRQRARSDLLRRMNADLSPADGTSIKVRVRSPASESSAELSIVGTPVKGTVSKFGNLPPIAGIVRVSHSVPAKESGDRGCVGTIAFNIWLPALVRELENAVNATADCVGIIIDLRGNPGGVGPMVMGFGGYFVATPLSLGTMVMRDMTLRFAINPRQRLLMDGTRRGPFAGPVAILVDALSGSTSEIFAAGMQRIGRARVFGEPSAGAALPSLADELPSGDVFVHAIADFRDPDGKRIEGVGVVPDQIVLLDERELARGVDAPLEAAIRWIRARRQLAGAH